MICSAPGGASTATRSRQWVKPELELLHTADESGVPVFGICFGGQMLAPAHGGGVQPRPSRRSVGTS